MKHVGFVAFKKKKKMLGELNSYEMVIKMDVVIISKSILSFEIPNKKNLKN